MSLLDLIVLFVVALFFFLVKTLSWPIILVALGVLIVERVLRGERL